MFSRITPTVSSICCEVKCQPSIAGNWSHSSPVTPAHLPAAGSIEIYESCSKENRRTKRSGDGRNAKEPWWLLLSRLTAETSMRLILNQTVHRTAILRQPNVPVHPASARSCCTLCNNGWHFEMLSGGCCHVLVNLTQSHAHIQSPQEHARWFRSTRTILRITKVTTYCL
jgi:hypothetical protein